MDDTQFLDTIRATYQDLDHWRLRAQSTEIPAAGSALAKDDAIFLPAPISDAVRSSLVLGGEHLRMAATAINAGQLYPSAHFTTLRGGLVGASQAVWILDAPDEIKRRERGLTLIGQNYAEMIKYIQLALACGMDDGVSQADRADALKLIEQRRSEVRQLRMSNAQLNQTDIINYALRSRFEEEALQAQGALLWRQMSSDAHSLTWSIAGRAQTKQPGVTGEATGHTTSGDLGHIAEPFMLIYHLLKFGWKLYDQHAMPAAP